MEPSAHFSEKPGPGMVLSGAATNAWFTRTGFSMVHEEAGKQEKPVSGRQRTALRMRWVGGLGNEVTLLMVGGPFTTG